MVAHVLKSFNKLQLVLMSILILGLGGALEANALFLTYYSLGVIVIRLSVARCSLQSKFSAAARRDSVFDLSCVGVIIHDHFFRVARWRVSCSYIYILTYRTLHPSPFH